MLTEVEIKLPGLHRGQAEALLTTLPSARQLEVDPAFAENANSRFKAIRCGRRWGKTAGGSVWIADGAIKGFPTAVFAPDNKRMTETYHELVTVLNPLIPKRGGANKNEGVIRLSTGGRIDFWTLDDPNAGRSRKYKRVLLDEVAFTKPNMMDVWKKSILPTLLDLRGECTAASNTNGINPDNFFWQICNEAKHGFIEVHQPSWNNPYVPGKDPLMSDKENRADRQAFFRKLRADTPPLVFAQEYAADFVSWDGEAFFDLGKWLEDGRSVPFPKHCDRVFAVIDSATKTGSSNDGTAVAYFARNQWSGTPLVILDWDIIQIEGALLDTWLPTVFQNLDALSRQCGAREGVAGVWIEDKASGMVLIQQAQKRGLNVKPIGGAWMSMGKDERAISVSSYHYQGKCKIAQAAHDKTVSYKGSQRNHLVAQVAGFRIGDKEAAKRADDLLDVYVHGLALALGDQNQF